MHYSRIIAIVTGLLAGSAACGSSRASFDPAAAVEAAAHDQEAQRWVTIRNDNWLDVTVHLVRNGSRFRLATVNGMSSATLPLPRRMIIDGTIRLMVDPVGSRSTYLSDEIVVAPGQRVMLNVHSRLSMSSFAVWNR